MKEPLFLIALATGCGILCMLWSNGFILHPAYARHPVALESVRVNKNLNLLQGQKSSINVMCRQGMIATGGGYTTGGHPNVEVMIVAPSGPANGPAIGYLFGDHNKITNTNVNVLSTVVCLKTNYP